MQLKKGLFLCFFSSKFVVLFGFKGSTFPQLPYRHLSDYNGE